MSGLFFISINRQYPGLLHKILATKYKAITQILFHVQSYSRPTLPVYPGTEFSLQIADKHDR